VVFAGYFNLLAACPGIVPDSYQLLNLTA
jgi:hypothetical protein